MELPWWSSGEDSVLPMLGEWVRSLVWELRSHMLCSTSKKNKKKITDHKKSCEKDSSILAAKGRRLGESRATTQHN